MSINFPTSLDSFSTKVDNTDDVMAVDINDVQDAIEAIEAKVGVDSSAVTTSLDYLVKNFIASGRKVYLYENTAPTGWSIVSVTDKVLAVKGGSASYNRTGGGTAGDFSHTHTGPSHSHDVSVPPTGWTSSSPYTNSDRIAVCYTGQAGHGLSTSRTLTSTSAGTGVTGGSSSYRPAAAVGIIVQKS